MNTMNISKNFEALRLIALTAIALLALSNGIWAFTYISTSFDEDRVYVVLPNTTSSTLKVNSPTLPEAKNQVRTFMELMFAHDENSYKPHVERALHLIDKPEGQAIYADFQKGNVYDNYVKFGSRSFFSLEDVQIDMSYEPFEGSVQGVQVITYDDKKSTIPIAATFTLIRTRRSDANPFGLLIKDWKFVEYIPQIQ